MKYHPKFEKQRLNSVQEGLKITPVLRPVRSPFPFKTTLPFSVRWGRSESLSLTAPEGMIGLII